MAIEWETIRIKPALVDNGFASVSFDYASTNWKTDYLGADGILYTISGHEEKTVPVEIGAAWRTANPDLERVVVKH